MKHDLSHPHTVTPACEPGSIEIAERGDGAPSLPQEGCLSAHMLC